MLTKIVLHGRLAEKFGEEINLGVDTPSQAIRALISLKPGFKQELNIGSYQIIRGSIENGFDIDTDMFDLKFGQKRELHIIPVVQGRKSGGTAKIIIGALIVVAAVALAIPTGGGSLGLASTAFTVGGISVSYGAIAVLGLGILLSGISEAIAPQPFISANDTSYLLSGQINVTQQGVCVPVVYGSSRVGSVVGAASYSAADFTPQSGAESTTEGTYTDTTGNSGYAGFGGGKSNGPGASSGSAADTLFSKATVTLMDILSEGPIGGLQNGPQSIFFNNVPLLAEDGVTWNFLGVSWNICLGTPDQSPVPGFPGATITTPIGVEFYNATPYVITTPATTADQARITVELPGLYSVDSSTGYVSGSIVNLKIEAGIGTSYTTVITDSINGKCSAPYQRSYVFNLPGFVADIAQSYNIRITRLTPDSTSSLLVNSSYISEYDLITNHQIMYSDTAYIVLTVDAESFGSTIPNRSYGLNGITVSVPYPYDPVARTYATTGTGTSGGTWDGVTTKLATTSNNAFCFYDLISNTRYGLGLSSTQLTNTKFDLYIIAQYCDGSVANGFGGYEPRYQFNGVLNSATNAFTLLQTFASTFRGMVYWGGGQIIVTADMPLSPVKLVTQANVIGGNFTYEGTPLNARHNQATVQWLDPNSQYQVSYQVVDNPTSVASLGLVNAQIVGYGVTSQGLAHRLGQWLLFSDNLQTQTISYQVAFDQLDVRPGEIVAVMDNRYAGARQGGKLRGGNTTTQLNLDSIFTPQPTESYTINVVNPDGTLSLNAPVTSFTTVTPTSAPWVLHEKFQGADVFANPWTFSRNDTSTVATYLINDQKMSLAAANIPRFDVRGLLIEPSSLNFIANTVSMSAFTAGAGATLTIVSAGSSITGSPTALASFEAMAKCTGVSGASSNSPLIIYSITNSHLIEPFTASAYVYIPSTYSGGAVSLQAFNGLQSWNTLANMSLTNQWQRLVVFASISPNTYGTPYGFPYGGITNVNTATINVQIVGNLGVGNVIWTQAWDITPGGLTSHISTSGGNNVRAADFAQLALPGIMAGTILGTFNMDNPISSGLPPNIANNIYMSGATPITVGQGFDFLSATAESCYADSYAVGVNVAAVAWNSSSFQFAVNGSVTSTQNISSYLGVNNTVELIPTVGACSMFLVSLTIYPTMVSGFDLASYTLSSFNPTSQIYSTTSYTQVNLASALAEVPFANATFILSATNLTPQEYQVVSVSESSKGKFSIFGVIYNIAKFAYIEEGIAFNPTTFSLLPNQLIAPIPPPVTTTFNVPCTGSISGTELTITAVSANIPLTIGTILSGSGISANTTIETFGSGAGFNGTYYINNSQTVATEAFTAIVPRGITLHASISGVGSNTDLNINIAWIAPVDNRITGYKIMLVNSEGQAYYYTTSSTSYTASDLPPDTYTVFVASVGQNNQMSVYLEANVAVSPTGIIEAIPTGAGGVVAAISFSPDALTSFTAVGGIRSAALTWQAPSDPLVAGYNVYRGLTNVFSAATLIATIQATHYTDSDYTDLTPGSTWYYWVGAYTSLGVQGPIAGPDSASISLVNSVDLAANSVSIGNSGTSTSTFTVSVSVPSGSYVIVLASYSVTLGYETSGGGEGGGGGTGSDYFSLIVTRSGTGTTVLTSSEAAPYSSTATTLNNSGNAYDVPGSGNYTYTATPNLTNNSGSAVINSIVMSLIVVQK